MIIKFLQSSDASGEGIRSGSSSRSTGSNTAAAAPEFIETSSMRESNVIVAAHLNERDFGFARFAIPELRSHQGYEDWLDFRQGSLWGLEMAGFKVEIIPVSLSAFEMWRRMKSTPLSISALDRFARVYARRVVSQQLEEDALLD
jgi:hypothetical protein